MLKRDKMQCRAKKYQDAVNWDHFCQCRNTAANWCEELTAVILATQSVTDLMNNQAHPGHRLN